MNWRKENDKFFITDEKHYILDLHLKKIKDPTFLHKIIKNQLPKPNYGLISAYKDIVPAIIKQAFDPNYVPDSKIPNV